MRKYEKLYEFISFFETICVDDVVSWSGGEKGSDGVIKMRYPVYNEQLHDFIKKIYDYDLLDYDYLKTIHSYGLSSIVELENAINDADQKLVIAILTYYVRQERFCDGLWERAIKNKVFLRILSRLRVLKEWREESI